MDYTADPNCQAAFLFREGMGTTVSDMSGHARLGTFIASGRPGWTSNIPTLGNGQKAWGAVSFSRTETDTDTITGSTSDLLMPWNAPFAIVAWVYPTLDILPTSGGDPKIVTRGLVQFDIEPTKQFELLIGGTTTMQRSSPNNQVVFNAWQHLGVTGDGSLTAANWHLYYNGVEVSSYAVSIDGATGTSNSGAALIIGNYSTNLRILAGDLAEIAFFNRQLLAAEFLDIYTNGLGHADDRRLNTLRPRPFQPGVPRKKRSYVV